MYLSKNDTMRRMELSALSVMMLRVKKDAV